MREFVDRQAEAMIAERDDDSDATTALLAEVGKINGLSCGCTDKRVDWVRR